MSKLAGLGDLSLTFEGRFDEATWAALQSRLLKPPAPPEGWRFMRRDEAPGTYDLIEKFRYKPGWSFDLIVSLFPPGMDLPRLRVLASVPDRDRPQVETTVEGRFAVPFGLQAGGDFEKQWLRSMILQMEAHEVDEWFTVDGVRVFDPHAKKEGST